MRLCPLLFLLLIRALLAGEGPAPPAYPLWDGQESVARYAERVGLPPTVTLECGNGVKLELVLIPAGKFMMGTPEPEVVDEKSYFRKIEWGIGLLTVSGSLLLVLMGSILARAIINRRRPQFSLARLLAMALAASVSVLSGMHWWHSAQALETAKVEYETLSYHYLYMVARLDEKPAHTVTLTRPFYMGKFEVTQKQYDQVTGWSNSQIKGKDLPEEAVTWNKAQEFCKRISGQTKRTVRLPTEAEWEYGCRGGTRTPYFSGDTFQALDRVAWYNENAKQTTHPVGQKDPNVFGLYDMHGNVWEWCHDWYEVDYYSKSPNEDPQGPAMGADRVLHGGYFGHYYPECRAANRRFDDGSGSGVTYFHFVGFRVVEELAFRAP